MLSFVYYLHWFLMGLVGLAGLSLLFRPHPLARLYMIGFLAQQLILNGCIMTLWENQVKVGIGLVPNTNEFIMSHIFSGWTITAFKALFICIIVTQILELRYRFNQRKDYA